MSLVSRLESAARLATQEPNDKTRAMFLVLACPENVLKLCARVRELESGLRSLANIAEGWIGTSNAPKAAIGNALDIIRHIYMPLLTLESP